MNKGKYVFSQLLSFLDPLEPMRRVGELDLRQQGLLTDTYLSFDNVAEGGVAVEPEAVFHGWR